MKIAFIMEIGLGHTTTYKNLRDAVEREADIEATWIPITFDRIGLIGRIPKLRHDIVLQAGLQAYSKLAAACRRTRFDALLFHTHMPAVFCQRFMRRIPAIVDIDCSPRQFREMGRYYGLHADPNSLQERLRERWYRRLFQASRLVTAESAWAACAVMRDYGLDATRVKVLPQSMDMTLFQPRERLSRQRDDPIRLLFVGGELYRKGGDLLLRWMRECAPPYCSLDLVTRDHVPETPRVTVHSDLTPNDPRLIALFQSADLFVMPTRADSSPRVLIEAMASGLPVLSSTIGSIPEMIVEGLEPAGVVVPPDDWDSFACELHRLCADAELLARLSSAARRRA